jgi:hypothetical protein
MIPGRVGGGFPTGKSQEFHRVFKPGMNATRRILGREKLHRSDLDPRLEQL